MNLRTLQALFVLSWCLWACMPLWGAAAFAAFEVLLLAALRQRMANAQRTFRDEYAEVVTTLDEASQAWLAEYAFFYTQRATAKEWARTLRAAGLALLLLVPVFAIHAFVRRDLVLLAPLVPATVFFFLDVFLANPVDVDGWIGDTGREAHRPQHDAITRAFGARALAHLNLPANRLGRPAGLPPDDPPAE